MGILSFLSKDQEEELERLVSEAETEDEKREVRKEFMRAIPMGQYLDYPYTVSPEGWIAIHMILWTATGTYVNIRNGKIYWDYRGEPEGDIDDDEEEEFVDNEGEKEGEIELKKKLKALGVISSD